MESEYLLSDYALKKRFERDFLFNGAVDFKHVKDIQIQEGLLPNELFEEHKDQTDIAGKIQMKEGIIYSNGTLFVSSHAGNSRINHFKVLVERYSKITGRNIKIMIEKRRNLEDLATDWVGRMEDNVPENLIIGSSMGISAFLG